MLLLHIVSYIYTFQLHWAPQTCEIMLEGQVLSVAIYSEFYATLFRSYAKATHMKENTVTKTIRIQHAFWLVKRVIMTEIDQKTIKCLKS